MKKNKALKLVILLVLFASLIVIGELNSYNASEVEANKGQIDLDNWNFIKDGTVGLNGDWELYFGELLSPEEIEERTANTYYNMPGSLAEQTSGKKQGYMTLHMKLKVPYDDVYGIYINSLFSSSDIWINGVNLDGHGQVATSMADEKPIYRPMTMYFPSINKEVDIVIHTSTYVDLEPSIRKAPTFGTKHQIQSISIKSYAADGFLIGILFLMAILSMGFYFTKPRQNSNIYFSCLCIMMLLRCMVFHSRLAVQFWLDMPYEVLSKTAAITFYLSVMFYALFIESVFDMSALSKRLSVIYGLIFTGVCLFTNNMIYDSMGILAQIIVISFVLYAFYVFINEIRKKNHNAWKHFIPFIILVLCFVNDALVNNAVLYNPYFSIYGMAIFIIIQSIYLVDNYLDKHRKLDNLNKDGLTSLYNNKYIKEIMSNQIIKYNKDDSIFTLIMIDIDDFKEINDDYGHMFGDEVLVDIANILNESTENVGYAGRFGGDEFVLIMPDMKETKAENIAEHITKQVEKLNKKYNIDRNITLSMGIYENCSDDLVECLNKVDACMYKAKSLGKNKIYSFEK